MFNDRMGRKALLQCCGETYSKDVMLEWYKARLNFWAMNYALQNEHLLKLFKQYYYITDSQMHFVMCNVPICEGCCMELLGTGRKRYQRLRSSWLLSGRTLQREQSEHQSRVRQSLKQDFFADYLQNIRKVPRYCCCVCASTKIFKIFV